MLFSAIAATVLMASATVVSAANHVVAVGKAGSLLYEPSSVTAKAGDTIEFQFMSKNHTITQSTFDKPCEAKAEGVDSGYQFIPAGTSIFPSWTITIQNDSAPLWFFCAQAPHCAKGMVFAVNPTAEKTFDKFLATAKALDTAPAPAASAPAPAATSATPAAGSVISLSPAGAASASTGLPVANAGSGSGVTEVGALTDTNPGSNGALGRAVGSWNVVVGAVIFGALVL